MSVSVTESGARRVERSALEQALREAEAATIAEFEVVRGSLRRAVEAATKCDAALAEEVVTHSAELERRYSDVHDRLLALIALQAPVASDLRLAVALLHVNDRIERMGAQCANIAKLCGAVPAGARPSDGQLECLSAMAQLADEQVAEAGRAFRERDADSARRLREHDRAINSANRRCFELAVHDGDDEARREAHSSSR